jgi:hypothetical protein
MYWAVLTWNWWKELLMPLLPTLHRANFPWCRMRACRRVIRSCL